jgi:inner membrane transporter RhtA
VVSTVSRPEWVCRAKAKHAFFTDHEVVDRLPRARLDASKRLGDLPGYSYFVGSAIFHYLGPAFAVLLFALVPPVGVAWLRIATAAVVYLVWRRPWRSIGNADRHALLTVAAMGVVLGAMNPVFYLAIDRLPLGTVAAIEFAPVIALAAAGVRSRRNAVALIATVAGVYLIVEVQIAGQPLGLAFAFANAVLFALYIVLAHRVSREPRLGGIDGLALAMVVALAVVTPIGGWTVARSLLDPAAVAAGIGVGVTSSVIPYVCDQLAMRKLARSTYALGVSLLPATAVVIGIVVLAQIPTLRDTLGVCLVVLGLAVHRELSLANSAQIPVSGAPRGWRRCRRSLRRSASAGPSRGDHQLPRVETGPPELEPRSRPRPSARQTTFHSTPTSR